MTRDPLEPLLTIIRSDVGYEISYCHKVNARKEDCKRNITTAADPFGHNPVGRQGCCCRDKEL
jgi:hypothetical protein